MKRIFILAIASVLATGIQGCSKIKVELAGFTKSTTIPATDFRGIEVHNGIEVEFTDECNEIYVETDADASIDLSGGSVARCNTLTADRVYLDASGGSVLKACGETGRCDIDLSGGSRLEGERRQPYGFYIDRCYGDLSGGSTATFSSDGEIDCDLSGGSHIYYIGDAIYHGSSFSGDSGIEWDGPSSI